MLIVEAIKKLEEGCKIRKKSWSPNRYVVVNDEGFLADETGEETILNINDMFDEYEIYESKKETKDIISKEEIEDMIEERIQRFEANLFNKVNKGACYVR